MSARMKLSSKTLDILGHYVNKYLKYPDDMEPMYTRMDFKKKQEESVCRYMLKSIEQIKLRFDHYWSLILVLCEAWYILETSR